MALIKSLEELKAIRDSHKNDRNTGNRLRITVGAATCGIAAGALETVHAMKNELQKHNIDNIDIVQTGCMGSCFAEPVVEVHVPGHEPIWYDRVDAEKGREIIQKHTKSTEQSMPTDKKHEVQKPLEQRINAPFYKKQIRIALRNCGIINPENIYEYIAAEGYQALGKALSQMTPEEVIETVKKSGLRGRGGGGFPAGLKWELARKSQSEIKYIICNADEGDPGAFMDRSILEGDPHSVLEAMAIAGYAIGAATGYIYIRAEYPLAIDRLRSAIEQAHETGLLGENILGTGFSFDIALKYGAGAFVCGEETALINSIEGGRGEPTVKPPFPAEIGLWKKPTNINNVETFANVCPILLNGWEWFARIGTEKSKGTKVFALAGKVKNVGLVEVPMGITLREIIYELGGGIKDDKKFKSVQTGGPSGGCIPEQYLDIPIDYDSLTEIGTMMGSGGMIVMDENNCMVNIAQFYLQFTVDESCGRCTACRVGNKRLLEILTKITHGKGNMEDLERLKDLSQIVKDASLCGLGQTAPNPILSTMKYFWHEYVAHVEDKVCPAGVCKLNPKARTGNTEKLKEK